MVSIGNTAAVSPFIHSVYSFYLVSWRNPGLQACQGDGERHFAASQLEGDERFW